MDVRAVFLRISFYVKLAVAGVLVCCSCAPLTSPEAVVSAAEQQREKAGPGPLARYLHRRRLSADSTASTQPYIAVLPFADKSGFRKGVWDLPHEMARLLSAEMAASPAWQVVPYEAVAEALGGKKKLKLDKAIACGQVLEADIVLLGTILSFNMERFSVGDPLLGGYKSYKGIAELQVRAVRVREQSEMGTVTAERDLVDRDLGLDLLGKPREQDLQFVGLKDVLFGSEAFRQTVLGQATIEVMEELAQKLTELVHPRASLSLAGQTAEILSVYGADVYINVGSENGLRAGYRFAVLPGPQRMREEGSGPLERIGVVEVQEVIGARLSSVRVLEGAEAIKAGDRLELMEPEQ